MSGCPYIYRSRALAEKTHGKLRWEWEPAKHRMNIFGGSHHFDHNGRWLGRCTESPFTTIVVVYFDHQDWLRRCTAADIERDVPLVGASEYNP